MQDRKGCALNVFRLVLIDQEIVHANKKKSAAKVEVIMNRTFLT